MEKVNPIQQKANQVEESSAEKGTVGQFKAAPPFQLFAGDAPPTGGKGRKGNLPGDLTNGFAASTGHDLSDVKVHYNSDKPANVGALAYAQGNDIHLASGQEKHLAHEAAHVVQQREGRVTANTAVNGMAVNDQKGLESEADSLGAKAMQMKSAEVGSVVEKSSVSNALQRKVIQKKDAPTNFGTFKTEKFEKIDEKGVSIVLAFDPDSSKVDATKIGLSQSVRTVNDDNSTTGIDPSSESRRVKNGGGEGYRIDRISSQNNPIYGADSLAGDKLEDTKSDNNTSKKETKVAPASEGGNATYQLGYAYDDKGTPKKKAAKLHDGPEGAKESTFETTALGLEGKDKGKYFGSVKWGYKIEAKKAVISDIEVVSMGNPSEKFTDAAKLWNDGKARGSYQVKADPARVLSDDAKTQFDLAKGTKISQISAVSWGGTSAIKVEILDDKGVGTGKKCYIKVLDVEDMKDGKDTVNLPIPEVKP